MSGELVAAPATLGGGRYRLGEVLGTGGMAAVRRGMDTLLDRSVAIKVFRGDMDDDSAQRAQREMQTLAALGHVGLVSVYDAGTEQVPGAPAVPYLVMELVDGPTLAAAGQAGALAPARMATIGAQLADALDYVHSRGIVHRDVKPANILLADSGPKLADFGIARIVDGARHTGTGLTIGTAPYLSPEQVTGSAVGPPADVYALGLVLLESLTGHREYDGGPVECALARLHRAPLVPRQLPAPWPELLTAMTSRDPAARPTARQVAEALGAPSAAVTLLAPNPLAQRTRPTVPLRAGTARSRGPLAQATTEVLGTRLARGLLVGALCLLVLVGFGVVSRSGSSSPGAAETAPAGSSPTVAPAGSRPSATPAGSRPSATPAGSRPSATPAGGRVADHLVTTPVVRAGASPAATRAPAPRTAVSTKKAPSKHKGKGGHH